MVPVKKACTLFKFLDVYIYIYFLCCIGFSEVSNSVASCCGCGLPLNGAVHRLSTLITVASFV